MADCAEGILTRREALRRLMLLGVGAAAATTLLAGCGDDGASEEGSGASSSSTGPSSGTSSTSAAAVGPAPLATEAVTFAGPAGQLKGSWSAAPAPKGAVVIIHENNEVGARRAGQSAGRLGFIPGRRRCLHPAARPVRQVPLMSGTGQ